MSAEARQSPNRRWFMLAAAYVSMLGVSLVYYTWTPALRDVMSDLSISYEQAGMLASVSGVSGGLVLPFAGLLADTWFGAKRVLLLGLGFATISQVVFAMGETYAAALISRVLCGVAVGLLTSGCYALALKWFEKSRQYGTASGTLLTVDGMGGLLSLYVFAFVLTANGWRNGLLITAAFLAALFIIALVVVKDPPRATADEAQQSRGTLSRASINVAVRAAASRNLLAANGYIIGVWGIVALVSNWVPTILIDAGWATETAGLFTALLAVGGMFSAVPLGLVIDKVRREILVLAGVGTTITICAAVLTIAAGTGSYTLLGVMLPVIGFAIYAGMPVAFRLALSSAGATSSGAVSGIMWGSGFLVGGFFYPYVMGLIKDTTGDYTLGFLAVTVATFVFCVLALAFARPIPHHTDDRESAEHHLSAPES